MVESTRWHKTPTLKMLFLNDQCPLTFFGSRPSTYVMFWPLTFHVKMFGHHCRWPFMSIMFQIISVPFWSLTHRHIASHPAEANRSNSTELKDRDRIGQDNAIIHILYKRFYEALGMEPVPFCEMIDFNILLKTQGMCYERLTHFWGRWSYLLLDLI